MDKHRALNLYNAMVADPQYTQQQINRVMDKINIEYGINVYNLIQRQNLANPMHNPHRERILNLGGHSGGGRAMSQYKSGHKDLS